MTKFSFGEYNVGEPSLGSLKNMLLQTDFNKLSATFAQVDIDKIDPGDAAGSFARMQPILEDAPLAACALLSACLFDSDGVSATGITPELVKLSDVVKFVSEMEKQPEFRENLLLIWGKIQGLAAKKATAKKAVAEAPQPDSSQPLS